MTSFLTRVGQASHTTTPRAITPEPAITIDTTKLHESDSEEESVHSTYSSIVIDRESLPEPAPYPTPSIPVPTTPMMSVSTQDLANLVSGLAQNQASLQTSLQTLVDNLTSSKKAGKPHEYNGRGCPSFHGHPGTVLQ